MGMNNKKISISDISYEKLAEIISYIKIINETRYEHIVVYYIVDLNNSKLILAKDEYPYSINSFTDKIYMKSNLNNILIEIIQSLHYLHLLSIFSCNINPNNILIDDSNSVYLSDYLINSIRPFNDIPLSSLIYLSPEEIEDKELNEKSDIWSMGCLIYYILTEVDLFTIQSIYLFINTIKSYEYSIHTIDISMEFEQIISKCIRSKSEDRMSLRELYTEISCCNDEQLEISLIIDNDVEIRDCDMNDELLINQLIDSYHHYSNSKYLYYITNMLLSNYNESKKVKIMKEIEVFNTEHQLNWLENADENLLVSVHPDYNIIYLSQISQEELSYLVDSFKYLKTIRTLKIHSFENNDIYLYQKLCDNLSLLCNLELLSLQYIGDDGIKILSNYLSLLTTLTISNQICLDLSYKGIGDDGFYELSSKLFNLPNLESLLLKGNDFTRIPNIFYDNVNNHLTKLECLDISCCNLEEDIIVKLKNSLTSLKWRYLDQTSNKQQNN